MKGANVKVFDQVTAVAFPGCSGGGVYIKANGDYVGMLTQGVKRSRASTSLSPCAASTPSPRQPRSNGPSTPGQMPTMKEIEAMPVEDGGSPSGSCRDGPHPDSSEPSLNFDAALGWMTQFFAGR